MKTTIKILAALAVMMGFSMSVMGQGAQSDNKNITAKAQVIKQLSVTAGSDLSFGMVTQNVSKTIGNNGSILAGTAGTGSVNVGAESVGTFTISKGANTAVTLDFTLPTELKTTTNATLPINFADFSGNKLAKLTGGTADYPFTPGTGAGALSIGTGTGNYYTIESFTVNIGGTVVPITTQEQGEYTGTITLTATYN
ncbi:DUF4402 domain-containing protein [Bacteroides sedimenti]|uniref:DUF4402 domain-containing protein n=1 Tax=Bacteroides sedimenti TaxID=2136147 RepID=A0ABN6ZAF1_9BACE